MHGEVLEFSARWTVNELIGGGGFGKVYAISSDDGDDAVAKFVPKSPGADRELLFVALPDVRNVVPVIEQGEDEDHWVLVMPRAQESLQDRLDAEGGALPLATVIEVLKDVADTLVDLEGQVVHRDIKPANILLLNGRWCLADFGISRYSEATTAPDTHKFSMSIQYAAPERWRSERATSATDVYALGVVAFQISTGALPFVGTRAEDFREAHLHGSVPLLEGVPSALSALVDECLYKAAAARPTPENLRARLDRIEAPELSGGLAALEAANRAAVAHRSEAERQKSEAQSDAEKRSELFDAASRGLERISSDLWDAIVGAAPAVTVPPMKSASWTMTLGEAQLTVAAIRPIEAGHWGDWSAPSFDVVAMSSVSLRIPANAYDYEGRSHSLWFGDIQTEDEFGWFETAFMVSPLIPERGRQDPFALAPGTDAAKAVWGGMAEVQLAWPFTPLALGELDEFIDRWAGWFASAAQGGLNHPHQMPERPTSGTYRRTSPEAGLRRRGG